MVSSTFPLLPQGFGALRYAAPQLLSDREAGDIPACPQDVMTTVGRALNFLKVRSRPQHMLCSLEKARRALEQSCHNKFQEPWGGFDVSFCMSLSDCGICGAAKCGLSPASRQELARRQGALKSSSQSPITLFCWDVCRC